MVEKAQDATSEQSISGTSCNPTQPPTSASVGPDETGSESANSDSPSGREIFNATMAGVQDRVLIPPLRSDLPSSKTYQRLPHSLDEFRQQEGAQREARLKEVWRRLTETRNGKGKEHNTSVRAVGPVTTSGVRTKDTTLAREKAEKLQDIYDNELLDKCGSGHSLTHTRGPKPQIPWKDFYRYAQAKEVGELNGTTYFGGFAYLIGILHRVMACIS